MLGIEEGKNVLMSVQRDLGNSPKRIDGGKEVLDALMLKKAVGNLFHRFLYSRDI